MTQLQQGSNGLTSAPLAFWLAEPAASTTITYSGDAGALALAEVLQPSTAFGGDSGWQALDAGPGALAFTFDAAWSAARIALPGSVE